MGETKPDLKTVGIAFKNRELDVEVIDFERFQPSPCHVVVDVKYCGVCHTDVGFPAGEKPVEFPIVCGHEMAGVVSWVGNAVDRFAVGDHIGIGAISDSCLACEYCDKGEEQYCKGHFTLTLGDKPKHGRAGPSSEQMKGGFSTKYVVYDQFGIKLPKELPLEQAAPLMCAGITVYEPLVYYGAGPDKHVGVAGIGGLGHLAVKLAKAMGAKVTAICTLPEQTPESMKDFGADNVINTNDKSAMDSAAASMDLVLTTVPELKDVTEYQKLLAFDGTLVNLGIVKEPQLASVSPMIGKKVTVTGSVCGSIKRTRELVDFCMKHNIKPEIEVVSCDKLPTVVRTLRGKNPEPKRYVLDMSTVEQLRA